MTKLTEEQLKVIIIEELHANQRRLQECRRHYWPSLTIEIGGKCTCQNCGGYMLVTEAHQYIEGFRHAGGNPNDVLPGYN